MTPHEKVYTRLKPSKQLNGGVGVFAIVDIPKGTNLFETDNSEMGLIPKADVDKLPMAIQELYEDFAGIEGDNYDAPANFNCMTTAWYLNHSPENRNAVADEEYNFFAERDIKAGEEILVDYTQYNDGQFTAEGKPIRE